MNRCIKKENGDGLFIIVRRDSRFSKMIINSIKSKVQVRNAPEPFSFKQHHLSQSIHCLFLRVAEQYQETPFFQQYQNNRLK